MKHRSTVLAVTAMLVPLGLVAPAHAADTVIGTVTRATPVDAFAGRVVWSQYDGATGQYRLVEHSGGVTRTVAVQPQAEAFDVDLGPRGRGTVAVYRRCRMPVAHPADLDGRHGCDLYLYDFTRQKERRLRAASSRRADEYSPSVWGGRLAFARIYRPRRTRFVTQLYWRRLDGRGATHRLRLGPRASGGVPLGLDLRERRVGFFWSLEYGGYVRLATTTGSFRHLVTIPGSGAAANEFVVRGVSLAGGYAYFALLQQDGQIWRRDISLGTNFRATARLSDSISGFAQDGDVSYYVDAAGVHRLDGLQFEPAPVLVLE